MCLCRFLDVRLTLRLSKPEKSKEVGHRKVPPALSLSLYYRETDSVVLSNKTHGVPQTHGEEEGRASHKHVAITHISSWKLCVCVCACVLASAPNRLFKEFLCLDSEQKKSPSLLTHEWTKRRSRRDQSTVSHMSHHHITSGKHRCNIILIHFLQRGPITVHQFDPQRNGQERSSLYFLIGAKTANLVQWRRANKNNQEFHFSRRAEHTPQNTR